MWTEPIIFDYPDPEENIYISVQIWDDNRDEDDILMTKTSVFNLRNALDFPEHAHIEDLDNGAQLKCHLVPSEETSTVMQFQMRCLDVHNVESGLLGFGKTDPYIEISKVYHYPKTGSKYSHPIYRSEVVFDHLNPIFDPCNITLEQLCDGNPDMSLEITLWDYDKKKRHLIGKTETNVHGLLDAVALEGNGDRSRALEFYKDGYEKMKSRGLLVVMSAKLVDV